MALLTSVTKRRGPNHQTDMSSATVETVLCTKRHLDPSSRLATVDGPNIKWGLCPFFLGDSWVPIKHKVSWAEAYLHTKWRLNTSSRLATI